MLTGYDPTLKPFKFPSMRQLNPSISENLEKIVLRAIELDPLKRHISMSEFKEVLEKYSGYYRKRDQSAKRNHQIQNRNNLLTIFYCPIWFFSFNVYIFLALAVWFL